MPSIDYRRQLIDELLLPTLFFAALGGMSWAVRGSAGFGGSAGCIFAGVLWGTAWWFMARRPAGGLSRRYASGWVVLAMTIGIGLSGARGWMQWPSFFEGKLQTNYAAGEFVPISRTYGFVWLFIAGMPWAGIGACLVAWCGSLHTTRIWHWAIRLTCAIGGGLLARVLFDAFPQYFLPLYESIEARYHDFEQNPNLRRLINDSGSAMVHLGIYLGMLAYEIGRRDRKNVILILTVGVANGAGWAALQNWKWAPQVWPDTHFNWWRCWESTGGISIGVAYGLAYFLVNRPMSAGERRQWLARQSIAAPTWQWLTVFLGVIAPFGVLLWLESDGAAAFYMLCYLATLIVFAVAYFLLRKADYSRQPPAATAAFGDPNLERLALYLGLLLGLGFSLRNGLKGWMVVYRGQQPGFDEAAHSQWLWQYFGPLLLILLIALFAWILVRPLPRNFTGDAFPHDRAILWGVLLLGNVVAQLVTGPPTQWTEFAFNVYYLLLFAITAVIVLYYSARTAAGAP